MFTYYMLCNLQIIGTLSLHCCKIYKQQKNNVLSRIMVHFLLKVFYLKFCLIEEIPCAQSVEIIYSAEPQAQHCKLNFLSDSLRLYQTGLVFQFLLNNTIYLSCLSNEKFKFSKSPYN